MNIVMMTNTYFPIVGGLEKSVEVFSEEYRGRGHNVLVVCPEDEDAPDKEKHIFRVPAIQNFNDTDFSVELPIPNKLKKFLEDFKPDIVHSHHPFLIGDTALRIAAEFGVPIVFTNHTLYEENMHYVPINVKALKKFIVELAKGYANLCHRVIAPSESIARLLQERGVKKQIHTIPTGIYLDRFKGGDGNVFRKFFEIPKDAFVIGIISRIAPEKNISFLSKSVAQYMKQNKKAWFVVVGGGPSLEKLRNDFEEANLTERLICTGFLKDTQLISAYKSLDVFAFASHSETQGLVLAEAMAAGVPVVGVDAPGVRDVVVDKKNGRMIADDNESDFVKALDWLNGQSSAKKGAITRAAKKTAKEFSVVRCVDQVLALYEEIIHQEKQKVEYKNSTWNKARRVLKAQTDLISNFTRATGGALREIPEEAIENIRKRVEDLGRQIFS